MHRPRYDDWTHPKGKLARGESFEDAALREMQEETGFRCIPGPELPEVRYLDAQRRPKVVRYWLMQPVGEGAYEPNDEVDAIRWVVPDEARGLLSYPRELDTLAAALALDEPVYLVRHGKAGARTMWTGRDDDRPLTGKGLRQAERLPAQLALDACPPCRLEPGAPVRRHGGAARAGARGLGRAGRAAAGGGARRGGPRVPANARGARRLVYARRRLSCDRRARDRGAPRRGLVRLEEGRHVGARARCRHDRGRRGTSRRRATGCARCGAPCSTSGAPRSSCW